MWECPDLFEMDGQLYIICCPQGVETQGIDYENVHQVTAMKLDYDPNVKVQMIRPKNKYKSDIQSAIDETAKYPVKDTDFMTDDEEKNLKRLSDLEEGLHRKRLISYGGLLKEIHKKWFCCKVLNKE